MNEEPIPPEVQQRRLPTKDMLMLALLFRPGTDFMVLGSYRSPQILMDLSRDEIAYGEAMLQALRPAIDALTEAQLTNLLASKMQLMGDPVSAIFNGANEG